MRAALGAISVTLGACCATACGSGPTATVNADRVTHRISPLIYGGNHDLGGYTIETARRLGGNRLSCFNWRTNASNAGRDGGHSNDLWLLQGLLHEWWGLDTREAEPTPGLALELFHDESLRRGSQSLVTVPLLGFVACDTLGEVTVSETAPSSRWLVSLPSRSEGDPEGAVYAEDMVNWLVTRFGQAGAGGVNAYSLGNEPGLWDATHPRAHPEPVTCRELIDRSVATARVVKAIDPGAEVFGPALWGMGGMLHLDEAPDWTELAEEHGYEWFVDAYLDAFGRASEEFGAPLLDAIDLHWYQQPGAIEAGAEAIMSAPRTLYDPAYTEPTWIGRHFAGFLPALPRVRRSIDRYNPGVQIVIGEYDWAMGDTIAAGVAQADALGAFGRCGVHAAYYHHYAPETPDSYIAAAFRLYRDGEAFGDRALDVDLDGLEGRNVYASLSDNGSLHVVLIDRRASGGQTDVVIAGAEVSSVRAQILDARAPEPRPHNAAELTGDRLLVETTGPSAVHAVVTLSKGPPPP